MTKPVDVASFLKAISRKEDLHIVDAWLNDRAAAKSAPIHEAVPCLQELTPDRRE